MKYEYGKAIKQTRKDFQITQKELSKKTGIPQQTISAYEKGTNIPNIEACAILADFYGITIDELIGRN